MSKYIFKKLTNSPRDCYIGAPDLTEIKISTEHDSLPELLEVFKNFLAACGYVIPVGSELQLTEGDSYEIDNTDTGCCSNDELRQDAEANKRRCCPPSHLSTEI